MGGENRDLLNDENAGGSAAYCNRCIFRLLLQRTTRKPPPPPPTASVKASNRAVVDIVAGGMAEGCSC